MFAYSVSDYSIANIVRNVNPPILFISRTEFARIMRKAEKTIKEAKWPVLAIVSAKSGKQEK